MVFSKLIVTSIKRSHVVAYLGSMTFTRNDHDLHVFFRIDRFNPDGKHHIQCFYILPNRLAITELTRRPFDPDNSAVHPSSLSASLPRVVSPLDVASLFRILASFRSYFEGVARIMLAFRKDIVRGDLPRNA